MLALLPIPRSVSHARFVGLNVVEKKLSDMDYLIYTPDRKHKSRVCHINMLKLYAAQSQEEQSPSKEVSCIAAASVVSTCPADDGDQGQCTCSGCPAAELTSVGKSRDSCVLSC